MKIIMKYRDIATAVLAFVFILGVSVLTLAGKPERFPGASSGKAASVCPIPVILPQPKLSARLTRSCVQVIVRRIRKSHFGDSGFRASVVAKCRS